jgi:hypothetical protein
MFSSTDILLAPWCRNPETQINHLIPVEVVSAAIDSAGKPVAFPVPLNEFEAAFDVPLSTTPSMRRLVRHYVSKVKSRTPGPQ